MVSFPTPISPNERKSILEFEISSKKRKWEEAETKENFEKRWKVSKAENTKSVDLHLEKPLPLEWQRCLDIQSGQIHFYNTRTRKRTSKDPRQSPERLSPGHMSLDLELNLPYADDDNWMKDNPSSPFHINPSNPSHISNDQMTNSEWQIKDSIGLTRSPSWVSFEDDRQEMVAAVCMRCHMLVMYCKSSPACPNCKFKHPLDHSPSLFKPSFRLLCCKD